MKLKSVLAILISISALCLSPKHSKAWGHEGHAIVAQIAMRLVKDDVKQNVLKILDTMSIATAANWMDIMKSNSDYDFMRSWHYVDFPKGEPYSPTNKENIITKLQDVFNELKHRNTLCSEQQRFDLLVLLHLMGDLHMPLHTGYDEDLGGNKIMVQYENMKDHNLHRFWDEDIIALSHITIEDCMKGEALINGGAVIEPIDFEGYMKSSRRYLDTVYDFNNFTLNKAYLDRCATLVKQQLLVAGMRLAAVLNKLFASSAQNVAASALAAKYERGIDAKDALKYSGQKVTACSRVYGIKTTDKVTFINVGDKYPNTPLTVVIFAKDRDKFPASLEDAYNNKNICVSGEVKEYKMKAEIVVTKPEQIMLQ